MRTTLQHVADALGLSKMTVSRALNGKGGVSVETQARVRDYATAMGYRPNVVARGLATRRSYAVALVLPELMHTYYAEVACGIEQGLDEQGYNLILCHSHGDPHRERRLLHALLGNRVDAIILAPIVDPDSLPLYRDIVRAGMPLVVLGQRFDGLPAPCVQVDAAAAARLATEHLLALGHRRVALLAGSPVSSDTPRMAAGYCEALAQAGVDWREVVQAGWTEDDGRRGIAALLERAPDVRAVVCANDYVAIGALLALEERGLRVPEDIALVGRDDIACAGHVSSPLTSVGVPKQTIGRTAAAMCLRAICAPQEPLEDAVVPPRLVVRRSCGAGQGAALAGTHDRA